MKSSDIIKLLKDKKTDLSKEEIEKIIEEELQKDESEIDADLIKLCLDIMKEPKQTPVKKAKKSPYIKIAFFAAAAAALILVNIFAFGKVNNSTPPAPNKNDVPSGTTAPHVIDTEPTETAILTDPVSDPTRASTTVRTDVFTNFLYEPEKIIFYHNGKPQTLTKEMCDDVIEEINTATRKEKWGMLKLAVFNEDIDKIKEENYCIEIHYDINSDGTQTLNNLNGTGIKDMTFRFEKALVVLNGDYENVMFFEKDGIYRSGPIKPYNCDLAEEILKEILDEWVTPPLTLR